MMTANLPKENEIVFCTVSRVFPTTVFCRLDAETEGVIPISEIAPGRIRNIRDHVREGKRVICKVLKVDKEKGHVTLSLRRVTPFEAKNKLESLKREKTAEAILKNFHEKTKVKVSDDVLLKIKEKHGSIFIFFQQSFDNIEILSELEIEDKKQVQTLHELISERVKPKKVRITIDLEIKSQLPAGVEKIKDTLTSKKVKIKYISAPLYRLEIESDNAKEADKLIHQEAENIVKSFKKFGTVKIID